MNFSEFKNLDINQAHQWPKSPKYTLFAFLIAAIIGLGWYFYVSDKALTLETIEAQELTLKNTYQDKFLQVQSLEALKKQKAAVAEQVASLEGLLPNKEGMDKLLADVNQIGAKHNLKFELFKPNDPQVQDYYALIPLDIKIKGKYHNVAGFVADVAAMPRIINAERLALFEEGFNQGGGLAKTENKNTGRDALIFEGVLNTYRLLDDAEKKQVSKQKQQERMNQQNQQNQQNQTTSDNQQIQANQKTQSGNA